MNESDSKIVWEACKEHLQMLEIGAALIRGGRGGGGCPNVAVQNVLREHSFRKSNVAIPLSETEHSNFHMFSSGEKHHQSLSLDKNSRYWTCRCLSGRALRN